jgi:hypothetical protein
MNLGQFRQLTKDMGDNAPFILNLVSNCADDDLNVVVESIAPSKDKDYIYLNVSIVSDEELQERAGRAELLEAILKDAQALAVAMTKDETMGVKPGESSSIYLLHCRWASPCDGYDIETCRLTEEEAVAVEEAIDWLAEYGGPEVGDTLPSFELLRHEGLTGEVELDGLTQVLDSIKLNSRYDEDPEYYGGEDGTARYEPFEARNRELKAKREADAAS